MLPCLTLPRGVAQSCGRPRPSAPLCQRPAALPAPRVFCAAEPGTNPGAGPADADAELWDRALLLRRALALSADEEDYSRAARVKQELFSVVSKLSTGRKELYVHLEALRDPTATSTACRAALAAAAACGDAAALPEVIAAARDPELRRDAERAAAAIRHRSVPPEAAELCRRGAGLLVALTAAERADGRGHGAEQRRLGEAAAETYHKALKIDANCAAAAAGRGAALYWLRRYDEAAEALEVAVALDPWHFNASRMLALARGQLKQFGAARVALAAAAALNPALRGDAAMAGTLRVLERWEADAGAWQARYQAARGEVAAAEERRAALEAALRLDGRSEGGEGGGCRN